MKTIVAIFDDISVARRVIEDLVLAGFARRSISLVTNDAQNQYSRFLKENYVPKLEAVTAVEGAGVGMIVGAVTGILTHLAAFVIPSFGLVTTPIESISIGVIAGALLGAIIGSVIKISIPENNSRYYAEAIKRGATLIRIHTDAPRQAEEVLHRYGTIDLHERVNLWRQSGWLGFDTPPKVEDEDTESWHILNVMTKARTSTMLSPMLLNSNHQTSAESIIEPDISDEDTERNFSEIAKIPSNSLNLELEEDVETAGDEAVAEVQLTELEPPVNGENTPPYTERFEARTISQQD